MKKKNLRQILLIGAILLVTLAVCIRPGRLLKRALTETSPYRETYGDAAAYMDAMDALTESGNYQVTVSTSRSIHAGDHVFQDTGKKILSFQNMNGEAPLVQLEETADYNGHTFTVLEQFRNGIASVALDNGRFSCSLSLEEYTAHQIPARLLDPLLYSSVTWEKTDNGSALYFTDASKPEEWLQLSQVQLIDAEGIVLLDKDKNLSSVSYALSYLKDGSQVEISLTAEVESLEAFTPADLPSGEYVSIRSLDIPRLLEHASGYLQQAEHIRSQKHEMIDCEAGNLHREQDTKLVMKDKSHNPDIEIQMDVELVDSNQGSISKSHSQTEVFKDGRYEISSPDMAMAQPSQVVTEEIMVQYAENALVGSIILPEHIAATDISRNGSSFVLTFTGSERLADVMREDACQILYQDPSLLSSSATAYRTVKLECILEVDPFIGLPLSSEIRYQGIHTIRGTEYTLESTVKQTYDFGI